MIRTYSDLRQLKTFQERFEYLRLFSRIGSETFGCDRYLNQRLYTSRRWRRTRDIVIIRDGGCDLGIPGREVFYGLTIHHMNPITVEDIENENPSIFDPEFLICVSDRTHKAIHYGDISITPDLPIERRPGDTKLW